MSNSTMIGGKYWHDADFTYKLLNFGNYLLHHYSTNCGQKHIILKEISWNITYQKDSLFSQPQSKLCWFFWGYSGWNWNYSFIIWRVRVIWTNLKMHFTLWGVIFTIGQLWSWALYILEKKICWIKIQCRLGTTRVSGWEILPQKWAVYM